MDFTNYPINKYKYYGGKNGTKICINIDGKDYMLKFPSLNKSLPEHAYSSSCISEYISCHIIDSLNFPVQKTKLGTYRVNGVEKIVVACLDFTNKNTVFKQFAELKNSQIETSENGYGTELSEVIETIDNQQLYNPIELKNFFWDMFIIDTLLGNFDRHNGNWGFLIDEENKQVSIAPIFDCASCLYPQLPDESLKKMINDEEELNARIYVFPNSALKINDKKINYFNYISSLDNEDCNQALKRIYPKINMDKITDIIDNTPYISKIRKEFLKVILKLRYEKILKYSYDKLLQLEESK